MILVDMSGILHRMVFKAAKDAKPRLKDGQYITEDYSSLMIAYFFRELIDIQLKYQIEYGEMVLLFDDWTKKYWRKDVYPLYKDSRKAQRDKSKVNYKEIYQCYADFSRQLEENTPWKCITVPKAEADDTILVMSREYCPREKILIYSADKDFIQAQRWTDNVFQYSALTNKWLVPENKHDSMEHWITEHVMLGDESDGVPKVVHHCEFSESFKCHLNTHGVDSTYHEVHNFKYGVKNEKGEIVESLPQDKKLSIMESFDTVKYNRNGEEIGPDLYKDVRFGPSTLNKAIEQHGSIDKFLDSHPLYRVHYDRNFQLVMEEGIPEYIREHTLDAYKNAKTNYNKDELDEYLNSRRLLAIQDEFIKVFKNPNTLTVENCGWL